MSLLLRRIRTQSLCLSFPRRQITSSSVPYPLGRRDPYSLPFTLTQKLNPDDVILLDDRPISLPYRVATIVELSTLDTAVEISRYAVLDTRTNALASCNAIIDAMCRAKRYEDAIALFHYFFNKYKIPPNTLSFNLIIKAHCDEGHVDDALQLYHHFTAFSPPDTHTFMLLAQGLVQSGRIDEALSLARSTALDWRVYNLLIHGFLDLGNYHMANQLFSQVKVACDLDGIVFVCNTFLDYWYEQGNPKRAREYVYLADKVELLSGNKLVEVLFKHGETTDGWSIFNGMLKENTFDSETINIAVNEYFRHGEFGEALEIFKRSPPKIMSCSYNNIIARFCEHGMPIEAESLLAEMTSPDVPTFKALMNAYVRAGKVDDALRIFNKMIAACLRKVAISHVL